MNSDYQTPHPDPQLWPVFKDIDKHYSRGLGILQSKSGITVDTEVLKRNRVPNQTAPQNVGAVWPGTILVANAFPVE